MTTLAFSPRSPAPLRRSRPPLIRTLGTALVLTAVWSSTALAAGTAPPSGDQASAPAKGTLLVEPDVRRNLPRISPREALAIADRTPEVRSERSRHPELRPDNVALYKGSGNWGISYLAGTKKLADITVDGDTGRVVEAWQGVQAAWVMARGHDGYFGERFDDWYIWLPLCLLFIAPFVDPRRPLRMLHLDLFVLVAGFGVSHFFFNKGEIGTSVPLAYPVLVYLLVRMLVAGFRPRRPREPLVPIVPVAFLVVGIVALLGLRVGLDLTEGKVGDVGYGSAVGAYRIQHGDVLYKDSGTKDQHFDTYGPVDYLAYYPFVRIAPPSTAEVSAPDDYELGAARAATITFDLLTILGLLVLGMRLRRGRAGRILGLALAYGWVAYPYTLFPLMTNSNDTLVSALVVWALVALSSPPARGALLALAAAAKFAPLALAPLFATGRGAASGLRGLLRSWWTFAAVFAGVIVFTVVPFIPGDGGLKVVYDQTIGFQFSRESPFSIWGQNPSLDWLFTLVKLAAIGLAVLVAFVPRHRDTFQVAALGAAVLLALQFVAIHWFYLYIVWFAPFVLVALFGEHRTHATIPQPPVLDELPDSAAQATTPTGLDPRAPVLR